VKASPWQILGSPDSVTMVKKDSFVGEHTPRIAVGGGIAQHDLALRKGKEYVGHVWLKPADAKSTVRVSLCWGGSRHGPGHAAHRGRRRRPLFCRHGQPDAGG